MAKVLAGVLVFVLTLSVVGSAIAQKAGVIPVTPYGGPTPGTSDTSDTSDTGGPGSPLSPPTGEKKGGGYVPSPPFIPPVQPVPPEKLSLPEAPPLPPPAPLSLPAKWPSGYVSIAWVSQFTFVNWQLDLGPLVPIEYRVVMNGGAFTFVIPVMPSLPRGVGGIGIGQASTGNRFVCFADVIPVFADGSTPFSFRTNRLC